MIRLLPLLAALLVFSSCARDTTEVGPRGQEAVHQATIDLNVVADFIRQHSPWLTSMMKSYTGTITNAVPLAPDVAEKIGPQGETPLQPNIATTDLDAADSDPDAAAALAANVAADQTKTDQEVSKEQEEMAQPWYKRIFSLEAVGKALVGVAGALKIASMLGVPWARVAETAVLRFVSGGALKSLTEPLEEGMRKAEKIAGTAGNLVESSEAGRWGLRLLNDYLDDETKAKLAGHIKSLTNGQVDTIEGLFKLLARAHATDKKVSREAADQLQAIRDNMETDGGIPPIVRKILKTATA